MATNIQRFGFHPAKGIGQVARPRRYEVVNNQSTAIFAGDFVSFNGTTGAVQASAAGDGDINVLLGAVAHCSYVTAQNVRVYTNYVPANTTYSPTARGSINATYVYVWDDPSIEYIVDVDVGTTKATNYAGVGQNMDLLVSTAGNTTYGRSGMHLDGTYVAATAQFRILEMLRRPDNDLTLQYQKVRCRINEGGDPFFNAAGT